ncbi:unnamed protein product, partial [Polarella glacialis]
ATILGAAHRSPVLASYRFHPALQQRLRNRCRVNLSFGLHYGWAIEGAVGSEFKIDASYLSPNVTIASSIENATRIYGVSILASQSVVELCSKSMASNLRLIDKVIIKGSKEPLELFCLDLDYKPLQVDDKGAVPIEWNLQHRFKSRQHLQGTKQALWSDEASIAELMEGDPDFIRMRKRYNTKFFQTFNMGYQNYSQGEWQVARDLLKKTATMLNEEDGPSMALLHYMEASHQFEAPHGWVGVHRLGEHMQQVSVSW